TRRGPVLKVVLGGRGFCLRLSPATLVLGILLFAFGWNRLQAHQDANRQEFLSRLHELELQNKRMRVALSFKEREKQQMLALAEARTEELMAELESRDREISQIWKVMGKPQPQAKPRRTALTGARGHQLGSSPVQLKFRYRELSRQVNGKGNELANLKVAAQDYRKEIERRARLAALNATPTLWPCQGCLSSGFGWRIHPVYGYGRFHSGVDITAGYGTPIRAAAAGRVIQAGYYGGYGNCIIIDHGNGLSTLYGHASSLAVGHGQFVRKGQTVAYVGSTGLSTGPHLHYEVSVNGTQVDPSGYLKSYEVR
ncbi:MAG: peptidoglycan DD-metalloendopeptidase family protein, partial [Candidatus Eremiobacterota bacterium]